jgi:hypothetical protein
MKFKIILLSVCLIITVLKNGERYSSSEGGKHLTALKSILPAYLSASAKLYSATEKKKAGLIHNFYQFPLTIRQNQLARGRMVSEFFLNPTLRPLTCIPEDWALY